MRRSLLALAALTAVLLTACTQWDDQEPVIGIVDTEKEESTETIEKKFRKFCHQSTGLLRLKKWRKRCLRVSPGTDRAVRRHR